MRPIRLCVALFLLTVLLALPAGAGDTLSLAAAVEHALASHPAVDEARSGAAAAAAAVRGARAAFRPRSDLSASATLFEEPMPVTPIHGLDVSGFPDVRGFPEFSEDLTQGTLAVRHDLYAGGARKAELTGAEARSSAAAARLDTARQGLTAATVAAYTRTLSLAAVLAAQERRLAALEEERQRVEQLFAVGRAADVERKRIAAALAAAEADRVRLATGLDRAERDLARLTGLEVDDTRLARLRPLASTVAAPSPRAELAERALAASPRLAAAGAEVRAAEMAVELAASGRRPRVSSHGAFQEYGTFDGLDDGEWQVGLSVSVSLFDGGRVAARQSRARAELDAAAARLETVRREVLAELDRALADFEQARARSVSLAEAVERYREVARVEALRLEQGVGTQADYLDAEADLLAAESSHQEARYAQVVARTELARVTGALEPAWIERTLNGGADAANPGFDTPGFKTPGAETAVTEER